MAEFSSPPEHEGGKEWSILDGRYDPFKNPVSQEAIDEITRRPRESYLSERALTRFIQVETLIYALGLCSPRLLTDEAAMTNAYVKLGKGGQLLSSYGFSDLQTKINNELAKLEAPEPPVQEAINDMVAKGIINSYRAQELTIIAGAAVIAEKGGRLPPKKREE